MIAYESGISVRELLEEPDVLEEIIAARAEAQRKAASDRLLAQLRSQVR